MGDYFISRNDSILSIKNIYTNILNDTDFTNVTLACDYGKQLRAHNVILSASSPYLRNILLNDHQNNALINLRGINIEDLQVEKNIKYVLLPISSGSSSVHLHRIGLGEAGVCKLFPGHCQAAPGARACGAGDEGDGEERAGDAEGGEARAGNDGGGEARGGNGGEGAEKGAGGVGAGAEGARNGQTETGELANDV